MSNKKLYELTNEIIEMDNLLETTGGELTPELEKQMEFIDKQLEKKVESLVGYSDYLKSIIVAAKEKKNQFGNFQKTIEKRLTAFTKYIKTHMELIMLKKVETPFAYIRINAGRERLVLDEKLLKKEYMNQLITHVPNKEKIKKDIAMGKKVRGASIVYGDTGITFKHRGSKQKTDGN